MSLNFSLIVIKDNFSAFNLVEIPVSARELKNINSCIQHIVEKDDKEVSLISIEADLSASKYKLIMKVYVKFLSLGLILGFNNDDIYHPALIYLRIKFI